MFVSAATLANCCVDGAAAAVRSQADLAHPAGCETHQSSREAPATDGCPEWMSAATLAPDHAVAVPAGEPQAAALPLLPLASLEGAPGFSPAKFHFAALPPPRTYLRFCRFLE